MSKPVEWTSGSLTRAAPLSRPSSPTSAARPPQFAVVLVEAGALVLLVLQVVPRVRATEVDAVGALLVRGLECVLELHRVRLTQYVESRPRPSSRSQNRILAFLT